MLARLRVADIIALSRTSKEFRGLLLSKRSISVWKAALAAEGCLECPADLSEPAYAVLLFGGTNCYVRISTRDAYDTVLTFIVELRHKRHPAD